MDPWIRDIIVAVVFVIVGGYVKYVLTDLKSKINKNVEGIEENEKAISKGKKELYEHGEKMYYTKETMDAKIQALKYRSNRSDDPSSTL